MKLIEDIPFFSTNYGVLCSKLRGLEFDNIFYEFDLLNGDISSFDVITWDASNELWTEYDNANIYAANNWLSRDSINIDIVKSMGFNITRYYKALYLEETIKGNIVHLGQFLNRECQDFKAVYANMSLKKSLNLFEYPNREGILHFVRDILCRPKIQLSVTIPKNGYNIEDIGIECSYPEYTLDTILRLLRVHNLISITNSRAFEHIITEYSNLDFSHFKLVYHNGKLQTCKLYLIINN